MISNNVDHQQLRKAAEEGNIELLYKVIQDDPSILERIDSKQFVETPLHIAASKGHIQFANEIMMLKPSFACKLNQQGYSPIHLAMQQSRRWMVLCFVDMQKDLVRVKGKEGLTPLHSASESGDIEFLAKFLSACPESIECLTARNETALHIAIQHKKFEALQLLVGWLRTNTECGATKLQNKILNQKDENGNTILHISAQIGDPQTVGLLVKTGINLKAKNLDSKTTLDMATNEGIKNILSSAGAKLGSQVTVAPIRAQELISMSSIMDKMLIYLIRFRRDISDKQRDTFLLVATLVATATYQSALSPPGGIYQADAGDNNNVKITSSNSTFSNQGIVGKSVMSRDDFLTFSMTNTLSFFVSSLTILILTPGERFGFLVFFLVDCFALSYIISMETISPKPFNQNIDFIIWGSIQFGGLIIVNVVVCRLYSRLQSIGKALLQK